MLCFSKYLSQVLSGKIYLWSIYLQTAITTCVYRDWMKIQLDLMFMKHYAPNRCLYIKVAKLRIGLENAETSHLQCQNIQSIKSNQIYSIPDLHSKSHGKTYNNANTKIHGK